MYIINFFIALIIPWLGLFGFFGPTESLVPAYFASEEAELMSAILGAVCGFWLGFLRNFVGYNGKISEVSYQCVLWALLILFVITKIIYAVPHMWFSAGVGFFLGVFAVSKGDAVGKYSVSFMAIISLILFVYLGFILTGLAWFGFNTAAAYYYIFFAWEWLQGYINGF